MKKRKIIFVFLVSLVGILLVWGCRKKTPEGPTDIRIRNVSIYVFDSLEINTSGGIHDYGPLNPNQVSEYKRFDKAYPKADIKLYSSDVKYEYGPVDYTYAVWLGRGKFTYDLNIVNDSIYMEVTDRYPLDD